MTLLPYTKDIVAVQEKEPLFSECEQGVMINKPLSVTIMKELIHVVPNALTNEQCDFLISKINSTDNLGVEHCQHAFTGLDTQSTFDVVYLQPDEPEFEIVHNAHKLVKSSWLKYLEGMESFHIPFFKDLLLYVHKHRLMRYEKGSWIHPHTDWDHGVHASCTFALNDESEYEGGDFSFWGGKHKVRLKKGSAMIFPADTFWVHEVEEITKGIRYSTNSFICSVPYEVVSDVTKHMDSFNVKNDYPWYLGE